jgi:hypothetical protein
MLIPLALSMANAAVRVTATDVRNDLFKATSEGVAIPIEAREVTLSATYPSGKDEPAKLAVLFEPKSLPLGVLQRTKVRQVRGSSSAR